MMVSEIAFLFDVCQNLQSAIRLNIRIGQAEDGLSLGRLHEINKMGTKHFGFFETAGMRTTALRSVLSLS